MSKGDFRCVRPRHAGVPAGCYGMGDVFVFARAKGACADRLLYGGGAVAVVAPRLAASDEDRRAAGCVGGGGRGCVGVCARAKQGTHSPRRGNRRQPYPAWGGCENGCCVGLRRVGVRIGAASCCAVLDWSVRERRAGCTSSQGKTKPA